MQKLLEAYSPDDAPVKVVKFACQYQAQRGGVYAVVDFRVATPSGRTEEKGGSKTSVKGVEAVEFTFVLLDIFDSFLTSIQGIAGPAKYPAGGKAHEARWVFDIEGAFAQYHALCFPSQARLMGGDVWRCNREECLNWLNSRLKDFNLVLTEDDVFPEEFAKEGVRE